MIRDDRVWMVGVIRCVHVESRERERQRERERRRERDNRIGASFYYVSKLDTQVVDHDPRGRVQFDSKERQTERERPTGEQKE